jgi:hypothetical protein
MSVRIAEAESHQMIDHASQLHTGSEVIIKLPKIAAILVSITGTNRFLEPVITA